MYRTANRDAAAAYLARNWRIRQRLPFIVAYAVRYGFIKADMELLNANVRITHNGILSQDFETLDGVVKVKTTRYGGGFLKVLFTIHTVTKNDITVMETDNLRKIYLYVENYLTESRAANKRD